MATFKYAQATVSVSNAKPGQKASVQLTSKSGVQVLWRTSDSAKTSAYGINLNSTSGALPVQNVSIAAQTMTILTSSASGSSAALAFTLSTFLAAVDSVSSFSISSTSDSGVQVTFAFVGQKPITLTSNAVTMGWPSA